MELNEFEKEEALQQALIERIRECDFDDAGECQSVTLEAAQVAHKRFFRFRFGSFSAFERCIVYANMGALNVMARERFRRDLEKLGARELAVAAWPPMAEANAHYTWAVLVDYSDCGDLETDEDEAEEDRWVNLARTAWIKEG